MTAPTATPTLAHQGPRADVLDRCADWFDQGHFREVLARRVGFRTESDLGTAPPALHDYLAREIAPELASWGFECEILPNPVEGGGPFLVARRVESADAPTVLTYGHGDVINGQEGRWREGLAPWELRVEGERWYGRGTADNKGQHTVSLAALGEVIRARGGRLGYNVTVLLETGEEAGSPGLRELCEREPDRLRANLLIASDGPRVRANEPTLYLGSRGAVNFSLSLRSRERAYHSGNWGGVLTNPAVRVAHAVACLTDAHGRMQVRGLLPPPIEPAVREALGRVSVGGDTDDPALDPYWGEPGLTPAEQLVAWNTIEVLALGSGQPERPINAIPPAAVAHCQLRFVPGTRWQDLQSLVREHLDAHGFSDIAISVKGLAPATRLDLANPWVDWALNSIATSSGKPVTLLPNLAGTLPNDVFADVLRLPTLWVPHSYPACSQHAPNEHLLAPVAREGLRIMAGLWWDLGEAGAPWSAGALA